MKKLFPFFIIAITFSITVDAQIAKPVVNENTIVKDTDGMIYPYMVWKKMISSGDYAIKGFRRPNDSVSYVVVKLTEAEKNTIANRMQKPAESKFFTTGEKIKLFDCKDINGNKIKLKDLEGKVVVLNFWFIGCPPCRMEIPHINSISSKYANDPNVVFIAVALDQKYDINQFIKTNPFGYHIIDDGRYYANLYKITLYPTNIVLDKEGKVRFHSSGYALNTPYWIEKTIEEVK